MPPNLNAFAMKGIKHQEGKEETPRLVPDDLDRLRVNERRHRPAIDVSLRLSLLES